jgi:hypothetical protein
MKFQEIFSPTPAPHPPQWQREYQAVLHETDKQTLCKRVEIAEAALLSRRETLLHSPWGERQEIESALENLRALKKEVLNFL